MDSKQSYLICTVSGFVYDFRMDNKQLSYFICRVSGFVHDFSMDNKQFYLILSVELAVLCMILAWTINNYILFYL